MRKESPPEVEGFFMTRRFAAKQIIAVFRQREAGPPVIFPDRVKDEAILQLPPWVASNPARKDARLSPSASQR